MSATVAANQLFNSKLNIGTVAGTESVTITNSRGANLNSITVAGDVSTTQTGSKILAVAGTGVIAISGPISNGTGTLTLTKTGAGLLTLSGNSSYSGGTQQDVGLMNIATNTGAGTGSIRVGAGASNPASNTQLQLGIGVNVANALVLNKAGISGQGLVRVPNGDATYSGTITINQTLVAGGTFGAPNGILTIAGDNTITNTSTGTISCREGLVKFAGAQNYAVGTNINGGGLQLGKLASMPIRFARRRFSRPMTLSTGPKPRVCSIPL